MTNIAVCLCTDTEIDDACPTHSARYPQEMWTTDSEGKDSFETECRDCRLHMHHYKKNGAKRMWWIHVRDKHPTAWAQLRGDAPRDLTW